MANDKTTKETEPEILERASQAITKRCKARLDEVAFDTDRYCHRDEDALTADNLKTLMDSLVLEGLQVPIEFHVDGEGKKVLVKGHRRVTACRLLADKNTPGFSRDMEVDAIQVQNATVEDLLIRSVADNEVRLNLSRIGRIKVAKKLYDAGVQTERAARALGISPKSYERDLLIARNVWMFQHVIDDSIAPTPAYVLLSEAEKGGRIKELKEDLDAWIAAKKRMIREKEKIRKAKDNKELRPAEKMVRRYMPNHLIEHWLELLRKQQRFDEDAQWNFSAGVDRENDKLRIGKVDL
jgi:ParB-like chromosome segregation protein Spo0J